MAVYLSRVWTRDNFFTSASGIGEMQNMHSMSSALLSSTCRLMWASQHSLHARSVEPCLLLQDVGEVRKEVTSAAQIGQVLVALDAFALLELLVVSLALVLLLLRAPCLWC